MITAAFAAIAELPAQPQRRWDRGGTYRLETVAGHVSAGPGCPPQDYERRRGYGRGRGYGQGGGERVGATTRFSTRGRDRSFARTWRLSARRACRLARAALLAQSNAAERKRARPVGGGRGTENLPRPRLPLVRPRSWQVWPPGWRSLSGDPLSSGCAYHLRLQTGFAAGVHTSIWHLRRPPIRSCSQLATTAQ